MLVLRGREWAVAVALSVGLHLALMGGFSKPKLLSGVSTPSKLQVRMVEALSLSKATPVSVTVPEPALTAPKPIVPSVSGLPRQISVARDVPPVDSKLTPLPQPMAAASAIPPTDTVVDLPPAPDYLPTTDLTVSPGALVDIDLVYPETALGVEGAVILRLLIGDTGQVDEVAVVSSTPQGFFEEAAIQAFAKA